MKLYMFEHCSLCFRVRMMAALKRIHLQERVVLDDDTETMVGLVGKRQIPILVKDDGTPMLESMDMVHHIEGLGPPVLVGAARAEIAQWADRATPKIAVLSQPRYPLLGLAEFATVAAHDHYVVRKRKIFGDLVETRSRTRALIGELLPLLDELDPLIESPQAAGGVLSLDDIHVLPLLRSAAVVKGLDFAPRLRGYFETMMDRVGFPPLPVI